MGEAEPDEGPRAPDIDRGLPLVSGHLPDTVLVGERFSRLAAIFELSALEQSALWILLAPEFDHRFLAVYRLLWGTRDRYPDRDFVTTMLAPDGPCHLAQLFEPSRPLLRLRLVESLGDSTLGPRLRPAGRLIAHIVGDDGIDPVLSGFARLLPMHASAPWTDVALDPNAAAQLEAAFDAGKNVVCEAPRLASVDVLLACIAARRDRRVLLVDLDEEASRTSEGPSRRVIDVLVDRDGEALRTIFREAHLHDAWLHLRGLHAMEELAPHDARRLVETIATESRPTLLETRGTTSSAVLQQLLGRGHGVIVRVAPPSLHRRRELWAHLLEDEDVASDVFDELASIPADLTTMALAHETALRTGDGHVQVARRMLTQGLPGLASRVDVAMSWQDVVLSVDVRSLVEQVRSFALNYDQVMKTWGLGRRRSGRGIKIMFSGPSGTGKTLTAGVLARECMRDLYRVDVSAIMSKWVGETEKHLARLFRDAEESGSALLFDEADALFGQRSGESGGGERFGNQLVNFLLESIESHEGMVILTTNFERSIDTAFARRLHYQIRFALPDVDQRADLWRVHLGRDVPLGVDVDLGRLAELFELTGGEIHQVAIRAAVIALKRGSTVVDMSALTEAVATLYIEKGRLLPPSLHASSLDKATARPPGRGAR